MYANQVEVYSKTTKAKQTIPAHWLDDPVLGADFALTRSGRETVRLGDGPSESWTIAELDAWLADRGVPRTGLSRKDEYLAAIATFTAEHTPQVPANQTPDATTGQGPTVDPQGNDPQDDQGDGADGTTTNPDTPVTGDPT